MSLEEGAFGPSADTADAARPTVAEEAPHITWYTVEVVLLRAVIVRADLALAIHHDEACAMGDGLRGLVVWMRAWMGPG